MPCVFCQQPSIDTKADRNVSKSASDQLCIGLLHLGHVEMRGIKVYADTLNGMQQFVKVLCFEYKALWLEQRMSS
jgi:hypothetical protein